ncbi:MAG: hypothetical protein IJ113_02960 [Eggerthellaceae bacterium]|nr:hypothetical protein [Eggerthellaceae bacterium]
MSFISARCPACGKDNEIDSDNEFFYCAHCGKRAITQAAISFSCPKPHDDAEGVPTDTAIVAAPPITTPEEEDRYLKRIFLFLEEGDWGKAEAYSEAVLDFNPECASAYLAKLMTKLHLHEKKEFATQEESYENEYEWRFALRFADEQLKEELDAYSAECERHIYALNEAKARARATAKAEAEARAKAESEARAKAEAEKRRSYLQVLDLLKEEPSVSNYLEALSLLQSLPLGYEQSATIAEQVKERLYTMAANLQTGSTTTAHENALRIFERLGAYKDSSLRAEQLRKAL